MKHDFNACFYPISFVWATHMLCVYEMLLQPMQYVRNMYVHTYIRERGEEETHLQS